MKRRVSCQIYSIIAVDPFRFVFCVCYFQPKTAIIDIVDDFTRALSSISPCTKPLLVCGDFNCRFDSGSRGEDLVEAMFTYGFTCVSDRQTMTYIAPQGSSCIDLVSVSRHHSHLVDVSAAGSLEKKHQHVSIIFKIVPDIIIARKPFAGYNPDVLQCSIVPSLFDNIWFDSECFALKQQVRDQYTVVKSWDSPHNGR